MARSNLLVGKLCLYFSYSRAIRINVWGEEEENKEKRAPIETSWVQPISGAEGSCLLFGFRVSIIQRDNLGHRGGKCCLLCATLYAAMGTTAIKRAMRSLISAESPGWTNRKQRDVDDEPPSWNRDLITNNAANRSSPSYDSWNARVTKATPAKKRSTASLLWTQEKVKDLAWRLFALYCGLIGWAGRLRA